MKVDEGERPLEEGKVKPETNSCFTNSNPANAIDSFIVLDLIERATTGAATAIMGLSDGGKEKERSSFLIADVPNRIELGEIVTCDVRVACVW